MRYFIITLIIILIFLGLLLFFSTKKFLPRDFSTPKKEISPTIQNIPKNNSDSMPTEETTPVTISEVPTTIETKPSLVSPLNKASKRITKKKFGQFITPQNSPIKPEKFFGFHTGTDFEIFPEELNAEVSVYAVCSGKLKEKRYATGYGGIVVQSCELDTNQITVVYGHLKIASITKNLGETVKIGEKIGILGVDKSDETDGERKHLHLGIHSGSSVNILGYVQTKEALLDWIDPCLYFCK
jgi:murein DD-endopeptidase MepM/ murein hydrolase activator NlpD